LQTQSTWVNTKINQSLESVTACKLQVHETTKDFTYFLNVAVHQKHLCCVEPVMQACHIVVLLIQIWLFVPKL